jgi:hypothetical protein
LEMEIGWMLNESNLVVLYVRPSGLQVFDSF